MSESFSYPEFIQRNLGFVSEEGQARLRDARILVCGVGGMGGACLQALVRAGVGGFAIADFDRFEVSNMNRQVFANLDTVGVGKVAATVAQIARVNPQLVVETHGQEWVVKLDELLVRYKLVVNGMDDIKAGIALYRKAREHAATVIDAYASPLPSVFVVRPGDPRPEERLGAPTVGKSLESIDAEATAAYFGREIEHLLVHSSSARHFDLEVAKDLLAGKRKRPSFAPMVITTGNLMAFEAVKLILGRSDGADNRGYFFNPWAMKVERPRDPVSAFVVRTVVRRFMRKLAG
jgi:molybdopterin/thiamine biosynthesis adenylyltransferase